MQRNAQAEKNHLKQRDGYEHGKGETGRFLPRQPLYSRRFGQRQPVNSG